MANAQHDTSVTGNTTNVSGNNNDIDKMNAPFTIQGYSDRYTTAKENHSEISCWLNRLRWTKPKKKQTKQTKIYYDIYLF